MQSRDGSRSTLNAALLLAGTLLLAMFAGPGVGPGCFHRPSQLPPALRQPMGMPRCPRHRHDVATAGRSAARSAINAEQPVASSHIPPDSEQRSARKSPYGTLLAYSLASVPDMMGDSPNIGHFNAFPLTLGFAAAGISVPIAGGDGYAKIADDGNPIPKDRVFFDYNYYNHAVVTGNGIAPSSV